MPINTHNLNDLGSMKKIFIFLALLTGCTPDESSHRQNKTRDNSRNYNGLYLIEHGSEEFKKAYMLGPVYYFEPGDTQCSFASSIPLFHSNFSKNEFAVNKDITAFSVRHWDGRGIFYYSTAKEGCDEALSKMSSDSLFPVSNNTAYIRTAEEAYQSPFNENTIKKRVQELNSGHAGEFWYSVSLNNDSCMRSSSPAERIEDLRRAGIEPRVEDFGPSESPSKVTVANRDSDFEYKRTYWRTQTACESELRVQNYVPDKYK